jgi:hypothetical protein
LWASDRAGDLGTAAVASRLLAGPALAALVSAEVASAGKMHISQFNMVLCKGNVSRAPFCFVVGTKKCFAGGR